MSLDRTRIWTTTLYAVIQSFSIARSVNFGRLEDLDKNATSSDGWVPMDCSFNSVLMSAPNGKRNLSFRTDPSLQFDDIARQLVKMLLQDLVTILDEQMCEFITEKEKDDLVFPLSKIEFLKKHVSADCHWSISGVIELVACRNVLTHSLGKWNKKTLQQVEGIISPLPKEGDALSIGFPMLFRYRKAMRTFIGEVSKKMRPPSEKNNKRKGKKKSAGQIRRDDKKKRREKVKLLMEKI